MRELAAAGARIRVPVAVACRVLKPHRQHYCAWLAQPVATAEMEEAASGERDLRRPSRRSRVRIPVPGRRGPGRRVRRGRTNGLEDLLGQRLVERVRQEEDPQAEQGRDPGA